MIVPHMRRKNLEITDVNEMGKILDKTNTIHLGLNNNEYPLILPLSFGYEIIDEKIVIYFHGGLKGIRYELLKKDNHVCVQTEVFSEYKETITSATTHFDSIIGFGQAIELIDDEERIHGMKLIIKHCGFEGMEIDKKLFEKTSMFKVVLKEVQCKSKHE
ncbi:pyridoxamine 5'-phosphate oxidase family protein [Methanosphaera sp.]